MRRIVLSERELCCIIAESLLRESSGRPLYYDYLEDYNEYYVLEECQRNPNGRLDWGPLINPNMYQKALSEFQRFGKLQSFPVKYVYQWMGIIMKNVALLCACTSIAGHGQYSPIGWVAEAFGHMDEDGEVEYDYDNKTIVVEENGKLVEKDYCDVLEKNGVYDFMRLPDGSDAISDYGLSPLFSILDEYCENSTPEQTLVLINKALDVVHARGDLSSAFIDGGRATLNSISNGVYTPTYYGSM